MHNWLLSIYVLKFLAVKQSCKSDSIFPNSIYNQGTMYFIQWKKVPFIYNYCMYTMTVILTLWITQVYVKFTKIAFNHWNYQSQYTITYTTKNTHHNSICCKIVHVQAVQLLIEKNLVEWRLLLLLLHLTRLNWKKKSDKILQRDCLYNITEHRQISW